MHTMLPTLRLVGVALAASAASLDCQLTAVASAASSTDPAVAPTLYACGNSGDVATGSKEILDLFAAAKSVCCDSLHERCDGSAWFPNTCNTVSCARAIDIVAQSCAATFAADGFFREAFKPSLDQGVAECTSSAAQRTQLDNVPTYVMTDPQLHVTPITTCHGRLVDGATSGFPPAITGQDAIVLQAPQGMQMRVSAEATYLPSTANIRFYDGLDRNAAELGILQGTRLDAFMSTKGVLRVLRAIDLDDDAGKPSIFSLRIGCVCKAGDNCGEHASCISGMCECDDGYSGAMCNTLVDQCKTIDCGAHGRCVNGNCDCADGYTGSTCTIPPQQCCSQVHRGWMISGGFGPNVCVCAHQDLTGQKVCCNSACGTVCCEYDNDAACNWFGIESVFKADECCDFVYASCSVKQCDDVPGWDNDCDRAC